MTKLHELKRITRILVIVFHFLKGLAIISGFAAAILILLGAAGDTLTTIFASFLLIKGIYIILGCLLAFFAFILTKLCKRVDSFIYFFEVEIIKLTEEAEKKYQFVAYVDSLHLQ